MGLLDDLKQQAESLRQKQQETEQVSQEGRDQRLQRAHAKLSDALHYWAELFDSLNVIKPVIPRDYYLDGGAIKLENLMQCDYKANAHNVTLDRKEYIDGIELRHDCVSDQKVTFEKQMDAVVRRTREYLMMNNLGFDCKEITNDRGYIERGIFTLSSKVTVTVNIAADLENAQIKITTRNLESFGDHIYVFDLDEFGKDVLEELAKVILAKPNVFRTMGKHQQAMRTKVTRAQRVDTESDHPAPSQPQGGKNG